MEGFKKKRRLLRSWPAILIITLLIAGGGYWIARSWYTRNLAAVSSSTSVVHFPVIPGSTVQEIAVDLKRVNLIRNSKAFETYVRSRELFSDLQAGTYALSPSMSTPQIVSKMVKGDVSKDLLTILPGKTIKQIRQAFKQAGYNDAELDIAFSPVTYAGHPVLASLPQGATLEGLLYPDSYQKAANTPPTAIIRQSLDEMQKRLTPNILNGFSAQGLNVYQGITLASIVYQESGDPASQPTVAQVFLLRLKRNMPLQSDPTAFYASDSINAPKNLSINSPYNTYLNQGLPPGPISNMAENALRSVANPATTDYLFFVAGDDGTIHFTRTVAEHQQAVKQYCTKECS